MKPTDVLATKRLIAGRAEEQMRGFNIAYDVNLFNWAEFGYSLPNRIPEQDRKLAAEFCAVYHICREAPAYWVNSEMTEVALAAGKTMPGESLRRDDLPAPSGFLVYDQPVGELETENGLLQACGVIWMDLSDRLAAAALLRDAEDRKLGAGQIVSGLWDPNGEQYYGDFDYEEASTIRTFRATWTLMQQTLTMSTSLQIDRAERRRCHRAEIPAEVLVVQLRRQSSGIESDGSPSSVEWSHRWLVSGHWRNQYLPSRKTHRQQWISGYVKGPTDKPLVVKDRVTTWVR